MTDTLIVNARLVNEGRITEADLLVRAGRIEAIGSHLSADGCEVVDAAGRYLLPGMIDDQVHFREPGLTHKGDIASESAAAVAGGITSYMEMPNTNPPTLSHEALEAKFALAAQKAVANYSFYLGASNDNLEAIRSLDPKAACGIKVFMGASTGNMLVDDPAILEGIFSQAPTLVATHCEDTPTIERNTEAMKAQFGEDIPVYMHPKIRSEEACWLSSSLAVELARKHGTQLHVLHLSTARELALFQAGVMDDKHITAEACVHFLHFDDSDYDRLGSRIKCNPAIKTRHDREALLQAILDGQVDIIATDHAPHLLAEKSGNYFQAPSGLPLVQRALQVVLEHVHDGRFDLTLVVEKTAHAPARRFQVRERGYLREGYWADLVLVDMEQGEIDRDDKALYKCGWTPFDGYAFRSRIVGTWVNGHLGWWEGALRQMPVGMRLEFDR